MMFLSFSFLVFSSLLSDFEYSLVTLVVIIVAVQSCFLLAHRSDHIVHNRFGLTIYRGVPIPFFDVLMFSDDTFRLVDTKHFFTLRDQRFFLKQKPDVLLIGSGHDGRGGAGLPRGMVSFLYNWHTRRGTQVIILKTQEACELFNSLKQEGKNVLFVLHNTC